MIALRRKPVLCNYYLTYRCNASCSFCDIWEKPSPYVTLENYKTNLKDVVTLGVKVIDFTGGEPLLHRDLPEMLRLAKAAGMITTVTTNCLLYPKRAEQLAGLVDMLHFSIDSADAATHDAGRGIACYAFVEESVRIAKKLGERPDMLFTVSEENVGDLEDLYMRWVETEGLMLLLNPIFGYNDVGGLALSDDTLSMMERFAKRKGVYLNQGFVKLRRAGGNNVAAPVCKAGSTTIVISPQNELMLPCYHAGIKSIPILGNLAALHASPEVQNLIALEGRMPVCKGCVINCYMQPSFATHISPYFFAALPSTLKYAYHKQTWRGLLRKPITQPSYI